MIRKWAINIQIGLRVPFTIRDVTPKGNSDNYIEYLTLPIAGSVVRYRLKGVVSEEDVESCIYPRLVFWGEQRKYLDEVAPRYVIKGRFDVELWRSLTSEIKEVTPRISFDHSCFREGQEIAICSVVLAVNPLPSGRHARRDQSAIFDSRYCGRNRNLCGRVTERIGTSLF